MIRDMLSDDKCCFQVGVQLRLQNDPGCPCVDLAAFRAGLPLIDLFLSILKGDDVAALQRQLGVLASNSADVLIRLLDNMPAILEVGKPSFDGKVRNPG